MSKKTEKRSSSIVRAGSRAQLQGVGARRPGTPRPDPGGGYQHIYTETEHPLKKIAPAALEDPRVDELRAMGLSPKWIRVAEVIGVEGFLRMWQILDGGDRTQNCRIYIPNFGAYLRYQRNRLILSLGDQGLNTNEIRQRVRNLLCEEISERHIDRILARGREKVESSEQ